jgi:uncharacterized protein YutE (UPF0331/DUF86 family)
LTSSRLKAKVVAERVGWVRTMLEGIRALPLQDEEEFQADPRNAAAAESFLRRALEALIDLGRHVLAKAFGRAAPEYKEVASALVEVGVLTAAEGEVLRQLAGYRNRMVHFYQEVSDAELYDICRHQLPDVEAVLGAVAGWIRAHPGAIDEAL